MCPFSIVEDRGFRCLMKTGRPEYYLPSRSTVSETYTNFTISMGGNSQPGFAFDTLLAEIDITVVTRIKYADVYSLILSWSDVSSNDDKAVSMSCIPNTLCRGDTGKLGGCC